MNPKIRWLALAAVFIMLLSLLPAYAADGTETVALTDTAEFKKLTALGILTDGEFGYVNAVSRGELFSFVVRLCGIDVSTVDFDMGENCFSDLTENDDYYKEILAAERMGLIQGDGGVARPYDDITGAEALKTLVCALGWQEDCEKNGGFPAGYVSRAVQLRIIDQRDKISETVTPSELLPMLLNTLKAEICPAQNIANGAYIQYTKQGETLLSSVHKVEYGKGIVEANRFTSLYGDSKYRDNIVTINNVLYEAGETGAEELLGYEAEFYYKESGGDRTLVYAGINEAANQITIVEAGNIESELTTTRKLVYNEENSQRQREARIASTASLIHNGGQAPMTAARLCPKNGAVTLIDNDKDDVVDVVLVTDYEIMRVKSVSALGYTIMDSLNGKSIVLDPNDGSYEVSINRNGRASEFSAIKAGDVISYAESTGHSLNRKHLEVSDKTVSDMITEISEDGVNVGETFYKVAPQTEIAGMLGITATFYLDFAGQIVDWDSALPAVYGFLNGLENTGAISSEYKALIFTENSRWVELVLADRLLVNGVSMRAAAAVSRLYDAEGRVQQLITYTVNGDRKINAINIAKQVGIDFQAWSEGEDALIKDGVFRLSRSLDNTRYRSSIRSFDGLGSLSASAKVFLIPEITDGKPGARDEFALVTPSSLAGDKSYTTIKLYNANRVGVADACVLQSVDVTGSVSTASSLLVVDGIRRTMDTDGEVVDALSLWYDDETLAIPLSDDRILSGVDGGLEKGDLVQCSFDSSGRICAVSLCFDYDKKMNQGMLVNGIYNSATFIGGHIHNYDPDENLLVIDYAGDYAVVSMSSCNLYIYDTKTERLTKGTLADVREGDYCFTRVSYLAARDMVIYR